MAKARGMRGCPPSGGSRPALRAGTASACLETTPNGHPSAVFGKARHLQCRATKSNQINILQFGSPTSIGRPDSRSQVTRLPSRRPSVAISFGNRREGSSGRGKRLGCVTGTHVIASLRHPLVVFTGSLSVICLKKEVASFIRAVSRIVNYCAAMSRLSFEAINDKK